MTTTTTEAPLSESRAKARRLVQQVRLIPLDESKRLPLVVLTNQRCPKTEVFIHWRDKDWTNKGKPRPDAKLKEVTCGGPMLYSQDSVLGETLTCFQCGYILGPEYGNPTESYQRRRYIKAHGVSLD